MSRNQKSAEVISIKDAIKSGKEITHEWSEPSPLPSRLLPVPSMEAWMLPEDLRDWLTDIAARIDVPLDMVAIPAMVAISSVIGSKIGVRPEKHTLWTEAANLWGLVVGDPGTKKTPAVSEVFAPVRSIEKEEQKTLAVETEVYEAELEVAKLAKEAQQRAVKKAVVAGDRELAVSLIGDVYQPTPPRKKRRIVGDFTVEKLGEICGENPEGVLCHRDELLTLFDQLDRPENAANRGFLMEGWGGQAGYTFDRIQRGEVRVERVNIALFGTTQPERISSLIAANIRSKNDGLVQRLQLLAWPDTTPEWTHVDRPPNVEARQRAEACFKRLHEMTASNLKAAVEGDGSTIPYLRMVPEAQELFLQYRERLEKMIRDKSEPPAFRNHVSKYRGLVPRIALICHLASDGDGQVSSDAMRQALGWANYLEAHARRAYGSTSIDHAAAARSLLDRIKTGDVQDGFCERDIYQKGWSNLAKGERLTEALEMLAEAGWLRASTLKTNGRPKTIYLINPAALTDRKLAA